jgi:spore germination cell wall hydrolase CwlJ-like protein|tara:strand:+ start:92 stop:628 length:537 start_codon:yes stop_codon:yes gene_type:complete
MNEELKFKGSVAFKSFLTGMGFGALLMFILLSAQKVSAFDENGEAVCLAKNIYFEAGNQPLAGKVAVAHVVFNRMEHSSYPQDICGVVYQARWRENWKGEQVPIRHQCQFSWFCDGKSDEPLDTDTFFESYNIAQDIIMGKYPDITEGATHYHSVMVEPYWAETLNETVQIQHHIFYK